TAASVAPARYLLKGDNRVEGNIEDQLAIVGDQVSPDDAHQLSTMLLRHYASSVHHRKYYGVDIVTCRVERHASGQVT
ncbi:MAG: hypothetical protein OXI70_10760, partial [Chloroflexota bacterium]|nr:hypothetical protein [Chloroflexota bacterium]